MVSAFSIVRFIQVAWCVLSDLAQALELAHSPCGDPHHQVHMACPHAKLHDHYHTYFIGR